MSSYYLDGEETVWLNVIDALSPELMSRGIEGVLEVPAHAGFQRGSGLEFEEKLYLPMDGFNSLCNTTLTESEKTLLNWDLLVPLQFSGAIGLQVRSSYSRTTVVRSAHEVLPVVQKLAEAIDLPVETPKYCDNLDLSGFFDDEARATDDGLSTVSGWYGEADTAFYTALFLRAAEHCLRRRVPMMYT